MEGNGNRVAHPDTGAMVAMHSLIEGTDFKCNSSEDRTMHEHCDICGAEFEILEIYFSGTQFLCPSCMASGSAPAERQSDLVEVIGNGGLALH
jgi:hypothetical protein